MGNYPRPNRPEETREDSKPEGATRVTSACPPYPRAGLLAVVAAVAAVVCFSARATAQAFPDHPVKIVVPYAPGGNTDAIARIVGQALAESMGQNFVVENRPGASGAIASELVARAPADGYTLLMMALPQAAILPATMKVKYDPVADFAPVSNVGFNPYVLTVNPSLPVSTVAELVEYARKSPQPMSYASGGIASHGNLAMALLLKRTGVTIVPVHLRGGSEQINNIVAGHLPVGFLNAADVVQQAESGSVRLIAITTPQRSPQLPKLPTMIEQGFDDFIVITWNGLVAPKGTPPEVVAKLAGEVQKAIRQGATADRLNAIGVTPLGDTPAAFAATIEADIKKWGELARAAIPREQ